MAAKIPPDARKDLLEWNPGQDLAVWFNKVVTKEYDPSIVVHPDPNVCITDDRPYNEYFFLRGKQL